MASPGTLPLVMIASVERAAPALAAGNTIVLKPAELTPLTALELERIALEAGIPEGVLNVVAGPGSVCGQRLVEHPDVAKIAFTGSTEVGRGIAKGPPHDDQAGVTLRTKRQVSPWHHLFVFADPSLCTRRRHRPTRCHSSKPTPSPRIARAPQILVDAR